MPAYHRLLRQMLVVGMFLLAVSCTGCNAILLLGYFLGGPPMVEPDFHKATKRDIKDKKKPVAVLCWVPTEVRIESGESAVDYELSKYLAMTLQQQGIKVIDPDLIQEWMRNHPDWTDEREIGEFFDAGYLIRVDIHTYTLYEDNSTDMYRGQANYVVSVRDVKEDNQIYTVGKQSKWPLSFPVMADQMPPKSFKERYLTALAGEIGQLFYEVPTGTDIPNRALLD